MGEPTSAQVAAPPPPASPLSPLPRPDEQHEWDVDWWNERLKSVIAAGPADAVRRSYEQLLQKFPSSAHHWIQYIEYEIAQKQYANVQALFTRCLRSIMSVDLWKLYLTYIKKVNSISAGVSPDVARPVLIQAYEFVLSHVGLDLYSTPIWKDFLEFIKSWEVRNPFEEAVRMDALRKTFHRAICIPMDQVEHIWKDYDLFENTLNKLTAKKLLSDKSPGYMTARASVRELKALHEPIARFVMAVPPTWSESDRKQAACWLRLIEWEKKNPLHYDDKPSVLARVMYSYRQALINLRFYPQLWRDAVAYMLEQEQTDDAMALLREGLSCCPTSLLLHFYAAELAEEKKDLPLAKQYFETLISTLQSQIEVLQPRVDELAAVVEKAEADKQSKLERAGAASVVSGTGTTEGAATAGDDDSGALPGVAEHSAKKTKLEALKSRANSAWIQYLKFSRRTEGIKGARGIFSRARKTAYCSSEIFIVSALVEFYCNKDQQVTTKIFEVGMKQFGDNIDYVLTYLDYLISVHDDSNSRALFERSVSIFTGEKARSLWEKFLDFENNYGDLVTVKQVEQRMAEAFNEPKDSSVSLAKRYCYRGLRTILREELGIVQEADGALARPLMAANGMVTTDSSTKPPGTNAVADEEDDGGKVVLAATKEEEMIIASKPRALSTVTTHDFSKPDLQMFGLFKAPEAPAEQKKRVQRPIPQPSAAEIAAKQKPPPAQVPVVAVAPQQPIPAGQPSLSLPPQPMHQMMPMPPVQPPVVPVPPAVAVFLRNLPLVNAFSGPFIPAEMVFNLLGTQPLTPPSGSSQQQSPAQYMQPQQSHGPGSQRQQQPPPGSGHYGHPPPPQPPSMTSGGHYRGGGSDDMEYDRYRQGLPPPHPDERRYGPPPSSRQKRYRD